VTRRRPGGGERACLAGEDRAVGGQREIERAAVARAQARQHLDQPLDVLAKQRLAACQAHLLDAVLDEQPRQPRDLLEGQQVGVRQEAVAAVEHLLGHAVGAAEVAAVGDRDAQVDQRPLQLIGDPAVGGDVGAARHTQREARIEYGDDADRSSVTKLRHGC